MYSTLPPADGDEDGPGAPEASGVAAAGDPDGPAATADAALDAAGAETAGEVDGPPDPDGAGSWPGMWVKPGVVEPQAASSIAASSAQTTRVGFRRASRRVRIPAA